MKLNLFNSASRPESDNLSPLPPKVSRSLKSSLKSSKSTANSKSNSNSISTINKSNQSSINSSVNNNSIWGSGGYVSREGGGSSKRESIGSEKSSFLSNEFGERSGNDRRSSKSPLIIPGAYLSNSEENTSPSITRFHPKARIVVTSGLLSLLMLGFTFWYLIEVNWAILKDGVEGRNVLRWVELGGGLISLIGLIVSISFIKTRRRSKFSLLFLLISILAGSTFHLLLSITNLFLIFVWKDQLSIRCDWGIDVIWYLGNAGKVCDINSSTSINFWKGWLIAAGVRFLITSLIYALQLYLLITFYHSLPTTTTTIPTEKQSLHPDFLPPMPDSTTYHEISVSEATTFDPTTVQQRNSNKFSNGIGNWIGSKVFGTVSWMFGINSYENRVVRDEENIAGSRRKSNNSKVKIEERRLSWILPNRTNLIHSDQDYFANSGAVEEGRVYQPLNLDDPHTAPHYLIPSSSSPTSPSFPSSSQREYLESNQLTENLNEPFLNNNTESINPSQSRHYPTGSSGSTGGSLVYIRMSDGKLVRKLSTIASESSGEVYNRSPSIMDSITTTDRD